MADAVGLTQWDGAGRGFKSRNPTHPLRALRVRYAGRGFKSKSIRAVGGAGRQEGGGFGRADGVAPIEAQLKRPNILYISIACQVRIRSGGAGGMGPPQVFQAINAETGELMAVKQVKLGAKHTESTLIALGVRALTVGAKTGELMALKRVAAVCGQRWTQPSARR